MKTLARRVQLLQPSPTLRITAKAGELKAAGKNVVNFGAGEPDFDTPEHIKRAAIKAMEMGKTKYTLETGTNELKNAVIAKLKRENGLTYTRDEVMISNGGKHCLFNIMMALVEEGDEVVLPAPYWVTYPEQIQVFGGKAVIIPTSDKTGFKITPSQLRQAITDHTVAFIINSPSNPAGSGYSADELRELVEICVEKRIYIISDEIYEHIVYDGFEHVSPASFGEAAKALTITVNGASKCYSMTGWRMGFAAGPAKLIKAMGNLQGQSTSNVCSITQAACVEAYNGSQSFLKTMLKNFKERREFVVSAFNNMEELSCYNPVGAFYVFPNISRLFGKKTPSGKIINSSEDFCLHLLEDHLVAAVHGSAFGTEGFMRLSYATSLDVIKEGVARIRKSVGELT